jgi:hypothetical protein
MNFIHSRELLSAGDIVVVQCNYQANVLVTDDHNFQRYKSGSTFNYHGGNYKRFPVKIAVPTDGYWNVTIDLGGGSAQLRYSIRFVKA